MFRSEQHLVCLNSSYHTQGLSLELCFLLPRTQSPCRPGSDGLKQMLDKYQLVLMSEDKNTWIWMLSGVEIGQELPILRPTTGLYKKFQGHPGPKGVGLNVNGSVTSRLSSGSASLGTARGKETVGTASQDT